MKNTKHLIQIVLKEMEQNDLVVSVSRGKYKLKSKSTIVDGIIDINSAGNAYVICADLDDDIFIHRKYMSNIVSGDKVKVSVFPSFKKSKKEGEIIEVIEHNTEQFVGVVEPLKIMLLYSFQIQKYISIFFYLLKKLRLLKMDN